MVCRRSLAFVVCCWTVFVVGGLLFAVCCLRFVDWWLLCVVPWLVIVVHCCLLFVASGFGDCCLSFVLFGCCLYVCCLVYARFLCCVLVVGLDYLICVVCPLLFFSSVCLLCIVW